MFTKTSYLFLLSGGKNKASSRVRGYWIAESLQESGYRCWPLTCNTRLKLILAILIIPFYKVIIFQKCYSRWHCWLLHLAKFLGKKTIFDLDDSPSRTNNPITLRNVEFMMQNASAVSVGSKALEEYASRFSKNVCLIPSSISLEYYQPLEKDTKSHQKICLGWVGNGSHYKEDLIAILREPLTVVARIHPLRFKLIGACGQQELYDAFGDIPGVELDIIDQIEWSDPLAVGVALQDVDIGLYPLLPNAFNQYKCGFKALEYMAMKIPVISSDVAENREIISNGVNGLFANDADEWQESILSLIDDKALRSEMGDAGRTLVARSYVVPRAIDSLMNLVLQG